MLQRDARLALLNDRPISTSLDRRQRLVRRQVEVKTFDVQRMSEEYLRL